MNEIDEILKCLTFKTSDKLLKKKSIYIGTNSSNVVRIGLVNLHRSSFEMSENPEYKAGQDNGMLIAEMRGVREAIDQLKESFTHLSKDIWTKIDYHSLLINENKKDIEKVASDIVNLKFEVEKLESAKSWVIRTVGGLIIAALLGIIYKVR